jgi:molybdopterin-guanine dinucleotide biosynthesis protein A
MTRSGRPTPVATDSVTGVILAGGQATRFGGRPKGLELVRGTRIIDRVATALREVTDDLLLVANDPGAEGWLPGVRTVRDPRPGAGSLGGLYAAVVHAGGGALVVAWDMPFVPGGLLRALRDAGADADAAVPESGSRRGLEPLCAFYRPVCAVAIERRLDASDLRVVSFFDDVRLARLPLEQVERFGDPRVMFMNVNTAQDLALAEGLGAGQITG